LSNLAVSIPACVPDDLVEDDGTPQFPDCSFDSVVNEGNYVNQVSCPVSDSRFVTCVLQGEGLVDADGEPVMDKMVDYAKALGLPWGKRLQNADMAAIASYGPSIFTKTVCLAEQCQALRAVREGEICTELDAALTRLKTALPDCAAEEGIEGSCSVDNASGCPLGCPNFVLCVAKAEGLVGDDRTPNMDAIQPIMTALGLEMPPAGVEGFLLRGRAIVNAVTELAQQCQASQAQ
jgi:hypothetical protein